MVSSGHGRCARWTWSCIEVKLLLEGRVVSGNGGRGVERCFVSLWRRLGPRPTTMSCKLLELEDAQVHF